MKFFTIASIALLTLTFTPQSAKAEILNFKTTKCLSIYEGYKTDECSGLSIDFEDEDSAILLAPKDGEGMIFIYKGEFSALEDGFYLDVNTVTMGVVENKKVVPGFSRKFDVDGYCALSIESQRVGCEVNVAAEDYKVRSIASF